jgi:hypothetical protein
VSTGVTEPASRCASLAEMLFNSCEPAGPARSGSQAGDHARGSSGDNARSSSGGFWGWVSHHKVAIGIAFGVIAIVAAPVALVAGAVELTGPAVGAGAAAVGSGVAAGVIDQGPCSQGNQNACAGRDLGLVGAAAGSFAVGGDLAVEVGLLARGGTAATLLDGAGALGWFLGGVGTMVDTGDAFQASHGG